MLNSNYDYQICRPGKVQIISYDEETKQCGIICIPQKTGNTINEICTMNQIDESIFIKWRDLLTSSIQIFEKWLFCEEIIEQKQELSSCLTIIFKKE